MIRFKSIKYYDECGLGLFTFKLGDEEIIGIANLEQNKKVVYTKLAKFYGIKGYTKYNKDDLIQLLVDQQGFEYSNNHTTIENISESFDNLCVKESVKESVNEKKIIDSLSELKIETRINPTEEMNQKIKEMNPKDSCFQMKVGNLKNCYAYRNWLWKTHGMTYDEEMDRVNKIIKGNNSI